MNNSEKTYEMLWDCKFCGQKKNLGLSHRCCPNCGGQQETTSRYFPSDAEKVAAQDHPYFGADVQCSSCKGANSRNSKCCGQCGSPLANAASVATRQDQVGSSFAGETVQDARREFAPNQAPPVVAPKKKGISPLVIAIPIVVLALIGVGLFFLLRTRAASFTVHSKSWERTIAVESVVVDHGSAWCDGLPAKSRVTSRHQEKRSERQIPDGENCTTRRKDQGNGTFKEVQECTPKFRSEPVMGDKCDYDVDAWKVARTAKAQGSVTDAPAWPNTNLTHGGCESLGCEREGARAETYTVALEEGKGDYSCNFDAQKWQTFRIDGHYDGRIGAVTNHVDCDSLVAR